MRSPFVIPCKCAVCGEAGQTTLDSDADSWFGGEMRHTDPKVCATNLAAKKKKLDKQEAAITKAKGNQ